jgi:DNA mismatch repair protein MutS2
MNNKALRILEYQKIIEELMNYASSDIGKSRCRKLRPSSKYDEIVRWQEETRDALTRIYKKGNLSFSGLTDVRPALKRVEIGASLTSAELLEIARVLEIAKHAVDYAKPENPNEMPDCLTYRFDELAPLTPLCMEIKRCIIDVDEISDDASPALKDIRRSMKQTNAKIHNQLTAIVNSNENRSHLQDSIITMRNGRYCVPVKAEHRSQIPGMIHDQSSSGSTLFVEPMAIVNLNNQLKELQGQEQTEIDKILAGLSEQVGFEQEAIANNGKILLDLDFIFAKAAFARSYKGTEPLLNQDGIVEIKEGRHPLLDKNKVVPVNITLGKGFSMLIVTGPNTGGKTVSLKTLGLFTLMGQAGLHIPARDGSKLAVFDQVYADIGDEQSIEMNLSTFSSHMTSIVEILNKATPHSLVLFDELCGGTDPIEGAALAIAILNRLHRDRIRTMATTHYSELKHFALATEGIENGCCEFNVETLSPTYRLIIGIPGKSNAFAISGKLGLPESVIEEAKEQISSANHDFEAIVADLEQKTKEIEEDKKIIERTRGQIELLKAQLDEKQENLQEKRKAMLDKAREEARDILAEAKETADKTIKRFHQLNKELDKETVRKLEADRSAIGDKMKSMQNQMGVTIRKSSQNNKPEDFHIGDSVFVTSMNLKGTVSTLPNAKGDMYVQMGALRTVVNMSNLELIDEPKPKAPQGQKKTYGGSFGKAATVRPEINLLGYRVDEALPELEKFLDDAYLSHLTQVTIIHGKGTGALRTAIQGFLKKQEYVDSFRAGAYGEGEAGVTVVTFK